MCVHTVNITYAGTSTYACVRVSALVCSLTRATVLVFCSPNVFVRSCLVVLLLLVVIVVVLVDFVVNKTTGRPTTTTINI